MVNKIFVEFIRRAPSMSLSTSSLGLHVKIKIENEIFIGDASRMCVYGLWIYIMNKKTLQVILILNLLSAR